MLFPHPPAAQAHAVYSSTSCTSSISSTGAPYYPSANSSSTASPYYPTSSSVVSSTSCTSTISSTGGPYYPSSSSTGAPYYPSSSSSATPYYPVSSSSSVPYYYSTGGYTNSSSTSCTGSSTLSKSTIAYPTLSSSSSSHGAYYPSSTVDAYPSSSDITIAYPVYPVTTGKPSYYSSEYPGTVTTTTITTKYVDICPTGYITKTATITSTYTVCHKCEAKPTPSGVPEGWYTTVTVYQHSTVTLTKPYEEYPATSAEAVAYPSKGAEYEVTPEEYTSAAEVPAAYPTTIEATSTVYQYITLTKIPVPAVPTYPPYAPSNGTTVYAPTGSASATGAAYTSSVPVEFTGATSRFSVGMTAVAVLVAGLLAL
ncbi:hypothetical protein P154DRAFT_575805 [Amniculicola lignicola CBS 123094]|uniref:Uncharacterized protein n=1 Tax=Amniculicola lignicola CBS 123094 TaxID=1392246 RepID=A0A6A5WH38_9PLEO|nr:hypothetical protein P154DRAFT_575805 [Amniculicola lignicola CBS 123094]